MQTKVCVGKSETRRSLLGICPIGWDDLFHPMGQVVPPYGTKKKQRIYTTLYTQKKGSLQRVYVVIDLEGSIALVLQHLLLGKR